MEMRKFNFKISRHGRLHRVNPFNLLFHSHFRRKLAVSGNARSLFTSPILDQGATEECSAYQACAERAAITGKVYDPQAYWQAECDYLHDQNPDGVDLKTALSVSVDPGYTEMGNTTPSEQATAWIYIYPNNGMDLYDSIQEAITLYQRPVAIGVEWYSDWEEGQNGIVPDSRDTVLGGHDTMLCGKVVNTIVGNLPFPVDTDRMANQNSWGVNAPSSDSGFYYFSRTQINNWFTGYGCAVRIDSTDMMTKILGKLSALYVKVIDLIIR